RVQNVVIAPPVLLEIALVVTGSRHRLVDDRQAGDDLAFETRMADTDDPRLPAAIAEDAGIPAGVKHRVPHAMLAENLSAPLHRIPLRDAAEVDAHAGAREADRRRRAIEHDVPPVHGIE